jgi:hypothetical protein
MTGMRHTFLCLAIALPILSASGGSDPLYNQFNSEAGSVIGKAGYATSHNKTRAMKNLRNTQSFSSPKIWNS